MYGLWARVLSFAAVKRRPVKRAFDIDIETCSECGGDVRIIASIEDPLVIQKILAHLENIPGSEATELTGFHPFLCVPCPGLRVVPQPRASSCVYPLTC